MAYRTSAASFGKAGFQHLLLVLGGWSIPFGLLSSLAPQYALGPEALLVLIPGALVHAAVRAWPRRQILIAFPHLSTSIRISQGDLLEQRSHLAVGFSDTFDTELGDLISAQSLQGQFLSRFFGGDAKRLRALLLSALTAVPAALDDKKSVGGSTRYPNGTTAVLNGEGRKFFCIAYSSLDSETLVARSNIDSSWLAMSSLWEAVRLHGERRALSVPVMGTGLARIKGTSHLTQIRLLLLSFIVASKDSPVAAELHVVVAPADATKLDWIELQRFAESLD